MYDRLPIQRQGGTRKIIEKIATFFQKSLDKTARICYNVIR